MQMEHSLSAISLVKATVWMLSLMALLIWYYCSQMQHSVRSRYVPVRKQQISEYMQTRKQQFRQANSVGITVLTMMLLRWMRWRDRMISTAVPRQATTMDRMKPHLTKEQVCWIMMKMTIMTMMYRWIIMKQVKRSLDSSIRYSCSDKVRWQRKKKEVRVRVITKHDAMWIWETILYYMHCLTHHQLPPPRMSLGSRAHGGELIFNSYYKKKWMVEVREGGGGGGSREQKKVTKQNQGSFSRDGPDCRCPGFSVCSQNTQCPWFRLSRASSNTGS